MAIDAQKRLWAEQMHQEYSAWIESMNDCNRARAQANGGPALITDPATGRQRMEGLHPGEMVWFDVKDGPQSQHGRRRFYGAGWHGPFPEYGIVTIEERAVPSYLRRWVRLTNKIHAALFGDPPERSAPSVQKPAPRTGPRGVDLS